MDVILDVAIIPAIPAQSPQAAYVIKMIFVEFSPNKRLALGLIPTLSIYNFVAVLFKNNVAKMTTMIATRIGVGTGICGRNPPKYLKLSTLTYKLFPPVINYAIPRPAVNKIKVATIGWIFIFATKNPFHIPHNTDTTSPIRIAAIQGIAYVSPLPRR